MGRTNAEKLAATQSYLGTKTVGVYNGIYTAGWSIQDFENEAINYASRGIDYAIVKIGEGGTVWYNNNLQAIRSAYLKHGVGVMPYWFNRPQFVSPDANWCIEAARIFGGIMLDCEDQFFGYGTQLQQLIFTIRSQCPDTVIGVTGYGDPTTAGGYSFNYRALLDADFYNPEWYIGYWTPYHQNGWEYAIGWADAQCAAQFNYFGLGADFPIQPAINVEGVNINDLQPMASFLANWKTGISVWENLDTTTQMVQLLKAGLGAPATPISAPPVSSSPTPAPSSNGTYTVVSGDSLSSISAKFGLTWQAIWQANIQQVPNPNLIYAGQVLTIPGASTSGNAKRSYTVVLGDNLSGIAAKLGISPWQTLWQENYNTIGSNPNLIRAGQVLYY